MFAFDRYKFRKIPFGLILSLAALCILGYLVLGSAVVHDATAETTMRRQMIGMLAGWGVMLLLSLIDYHFILKLYPLIYLGLTGILVLLYTPLGKTYKQATRWLEIPRLGEIQPSEFAKILMILFFAWFFGKYKDKMNRFPYVLLTLGLFAVPALLIFREPDLSSTFIFAATFLVIYFAAGVSWKWIGFAALGLIPVGAFLAWDSMQEEPKVLKPYMLNRISSFFHPEEYASTGLVDQQEKAVMAISSGQWSGKGLYNASLESVKNGQMLSEENCDFIFAVVGEEMGFLGSAVVVLLFMLAVLFCFRIAATARDREGRFIALGVGFLLALEVFINVGVTSGILPNTGIALPFFSAGLSSLVSSLVAFGFVINVALQREEKDKTDRELMKMPLTF